MLHTYQAQIELYTPSLPASLPRHLLPFHPHCRSTSDQPPPPQIFFYLSFHTPLVVLRLTHVIQSRSPCPLLRSLHDFYPPHVRTVNFHPHLHPRHQQPVPQQDCSVHALPPYAQAYTSERITGLECCEEDVTWIWHIRVIAIEKAGASAIRVKFGDVGGIMVGKWEGVELGGGWWGRIGLDLLRCYEREKD